MALDTHTVAAVRLSVGIHPATESGLNVLLPLLLQEGAFPGPLLGPMTKASSSERMQPAVG